MIPFPYHIRPIEPEKDAAAISNLIQTCFHPWLESDNMDYLRELHDAGEYAVKHPFFVKFTGFSYHIPGVVCVDGNGTILGLINTNIFYQNSRQCCLLSNICVDPKHRREGIASHMIVETEREQRSSGVYGLYLQARMENDPIYLLYKKNGFSVTDFRETWILPKGKKEPEQRASQYHPEIVPGKEMEEFEQSFNSRYPSSILWNLDYRSDLFRPGYLSYAFNYMFFTGNCFLRITDENGETKAWAAFQQLNGAADQLWFIPKEGISEEDQTAILNLLRHTYKGKKPLKIDVPSGHPSAIWQNAGFTRLHTLAWMWKKL